MMSSKNPHGKKESVATKIAKENEIGMKFGSL